MIKYLLAFSIGILSACGYNESGIVGPEKHINKPTPVKTIPNIPNIH